MTIKKIELDVKHTVPSHIEKLELLADGRTKLLHFVIDEFPDENALRVDDNLLIEGALFPRPDDEGDRDNDNSLFIFLVAISTTSSTLSLLIFITD